MALIVFCVALRATPNDIASLLRQPSLLVRSLFAMNVIVPLFAIALVLLFQLRHELAITLIALSVSPIPPFVPKKQIKASNDASYVIGLLAIVGVVSIVFVPGAVALLGWFSGHPLNVPVETIAWIIGTSVLAPIFAGMLVHAVAPPLAERIADGLSLASTILLLAPPASGSDLYLARDLGIDRQPHPRRDRGFRIVWPRCRPCPRRPQPRQSHGPRPFRLRHVIRPLRSRSSRLTCSPAPPI